MHSRIASAGTGSLAFAHLCGDLTMKSVLQIESGSVPRRIKTRNVRQFAALTIALAAASPVFAQGSPWETAVNNLQTSFTGPIAKGLSLVALVVGGLMFAYSEGGSKKVFAGIVFGLGMALGAANFMAWLFP
jgi:type IV secretory pathway VirB2 component (pilin)